MPSPTYTARLGLILQYALQPDWGTNANGVFSTLDAQNALGSLAVSLHETPSTTLAVKVAAGAIRSAAGARIAVAANGNYALGASVTTSIWVTDAGVISSATTGFPAGNIVRLAVVTTDGTKVAGITDSRDYLFSFAGSPPVFVASGASHAAGLVPDPGAVAGATKALFEDATWKVPPTFGPSGTGHAAGYVPDPPALAGSVLFLCEDGVWRTPAGTGADAAAAYVTIGHPTGLSAERALVGTANQVVVTDGGANGNVVLSLPQSIDTSATVNFGDVIASAGVTAASGHFSALTNSVAACSFKNAHWNLAIKTAAYTITPTDRYILADSTGGAFSVTLPDATAGNVTGLPLLVKRIDSSGNTVTVVTTAGQTIEGLTTYPLSTQWEWVEVISDSANWYIANKG
jgi:hypothetical protein